MNEFVRMIHEFHDKQSFSVNVDIKTCKPTTVVQTTLNEACGALYKVSKVMEQMMKEGCEDVRVHRAHLLIEELGETIDAMADYNEVETLDGLADLVYVTIGTAIVFGLPFLPALLKVCEANLTKNVRHEDDPRCRHKGSSFKPPNIASILKYHREGGRWCAICGTRRVDRHNECSNCCGDK